MYMQEWYVFAWCVILVILETGAVLVYIVNNYLWMKTYMSRKVSDSNAKSDIQLNCSIVQTKTNESSNHRNSTARIHRNWQGTIRNVSPLRFHIN